MSSYAQQKASQKYDKSHTKSVLLKLNLASDADILTRLDEVNNKQGYIKNLVRDDIRGRGSILTLDAIRLLIMPAARKFNVNKVYLFGSYARGEANTESDVDLMVEGGSITTMSSFLDLIDSFEKSLKKTVDVVTSNKMEDDNSRSGRRLRANIERDKVLIYDNN